MSVPSSVRSSERYSARPSARYCPAEQRAERTEGRAQRGEGRALVLTLVCRLGQLHLHRRLVEGLVRDGMPMLETSK